MAGKIKHKKRSHKTYTKEPIFKSRDCAKHGIDSGLFNLIFGKRGK